MLEHLKHLKQPGNSRHRRLENLQRDSVCASEPLDSESQSLGRIKPAMIIVSMPAQLRLLCWQSYGALSET